MYNTAYTHKVCLLDGPEIRCIIRNSVSGFEILAEVSMKLVLCDLKPCVLVSTNVSQ